MERHVKLKTILTTLLAGSACALMAAAPASADRYDNRRGPATGDVVLFEHSNFEGQAVEITGAVPFLNEARFNDRTSSIAIRRGAWEVCTDANFRGRCEVIQGNVDRLNYLQLNDNISSIRPVSGRFGFNHRGNGGRYGNRGYGNDRYGDNRWGYNDGPASRADIVLFEDSYFSGRALAVNGDLPDFADTGLNDRISSIQVNRGAWEICVDSVFRGRCTVVTRSSDALNDIRMNDNISSIRRIG